MTDSVVLSTDRVWQSPSSTCFLKRTGEAIACSQMKTELIGRLLGWLFPGPDASASVALSVFAKCRLVRDLPSAIQWF